MVRKAQRQPETVSSDELEVRLDKWLHSARFYKTRSLATQMVEGGKVFYNGQRVKPSRVVEIGAEITITKPNNERLSVIVQELSNRRTQYSVAKNYYAETDASIQARNQAAQQRELEKRSFVAPTHKPNKKDRRELMKFKFDKSQYEG